MRKVIFAGAAAAIATGLAVTVSATASPGTKTENLSFIDTSNNPNSHVYSAIATGDFTAGGTASLGSHGHPGTLRLSNGTIKLRAKTGPLHTHGNATTCLETTVDSGTYTLSNGTGAYKGIIGSGKLTLRFRAVGPIVHGKCEIPTTAAAQNIITLSGPVSLP